VRGSKARRVLEFYRLHFNTLPPFRVLCDGTIINQALSGKTFLREALPTLLGNESTRLVVTSCIVTELRRLGEEFSGASLLASRATRVPCSHGQKVVPAAECVLELLKDENHGLLLGTVDMGLIRATRSLGTTPIITFSSGSLILETPSRESRALALLRESQKRMISSKPPPNQTEDDKRPRRRPRKAKGPNPLSVKKKKASTTSHGASQEGLSAADSNRKKSKSKSAPLSPSVSITDPGTERTATKAPEDEAKPSGSEKLLSGQTADHVSKPPLVRKRGKKKRKAPQTLADVGQTSDYVSETKRKKKRRRTKTSTGQPAQR